MAAREDCLAQGYYTRTALEIVWSGTNLSKSGAVMVIDDETDILAIIRSSLTRKGYDVDTFSDSLLALDAFRSNPSKYGLILSDIRMPKMNGFEFSRAARKMHPDIKIIFMTAFEIDKSEFDVVMPSLKINAFIAKPFHASKLYDLISQVQFGLEYGSNEEKGERRTA